MIFLSHKNTRAPQKAQAGQLLLLVLIFTSVFLVIVSSFIGSVISQARVVDVRFEQQRATEIAEAGLNYYKWYLSHFPGDTSGDGVSTVFFDQVTGEAIGEYELDISTNSYCGVISSLEVQSTGFTYSNPDARAIISATYKRPTVAEFSFITNVATWYGDTRVITGPVHGNQGLKMDGFHNSRVGSGQTTWSCDSGFGCSPTLPNAPGVHTESGNANPGLFEVGVDPIDFLGLTIDLAQMRTSAQADGIYFGPTSGFGYRAIFQNDGTVDVFRVTNTPTYTARSDAEGVHTDERNVIFGQTYLGTRTIDPLCPVLFFQDKLWIEGEIDQKVAVAAGLNTSNVQNNIVLNGNLTYEAGTNAGLVAIAEDDIDIGFVVPNNMIANGIFIAQNGRFGRNHYDAANFSTFYDQFVSRDSLTRLGSVVSNGRVGTEWSSGGVHTSGFRSRITSFDRDQVDDPPPLTPETNDVYELQDWRQEG